MTWVDAAISRVKLLGTFRSDHIWIQYENKVC